MGETWCKGSTKTRGTLVDADGIILQTANRVLASTVLWRPGSGICRGTLASRATDGRERHREFRFVEYPGHPEIFADRRRQPMWSRRRP